MPVYEEKGLVNGQKRWFIRTYITDEYGNRKQITRHNKDWIGREGKKEAECEEKRLQNKKANSFENTSLDNLFYDFLDYKKNSVKESTYLKLKDNYNNYIKCFFQNKKFFHISTLDIRDWKEMMNNKDLSLNTKRNAFLTLSQALDYGCQYYGLEKNVAKICKNFTALKGTKKRKMKFLTDSQFDMAIKFENDFIYFVALNILFYSGIRRGELLSLNKFNDIDFENKTLTIDETINPKISSSPTPPKTDKSNRTIQVLPFLMNLLKVIIDNDDSEDGYIFLHKIKLTTLKYKFDKIQEKIGLPKDKIIRVHDLRHSFASYCINNGVEIQILSEYMEHENISITWDTYGHLYPNSQKKLLDKINKHFEKQDQKQDQNFTNDSFSL